MSVCCVFHRIVATVTFKHIVTTTLDHIVTTVALDHIVITMTLDHIFTTIILDRIIVTVTEYTSVAFDTIVAFGISLVAVLTSSPVMWPKEHL
jgi:hypothetical protein